MKKYFKKFKIRVFIQVLLICINIFLGIFLYFLYQNFLMVGISLIILLSLVYYHVKYMDQTNRNFKRFLEAINYSDFSQSFTDKNLGKSFSELSQAFTQVVEKFQKARADKEKSFRYMNTIVQYINNGLISFDQEGNVDFINRAAKKILNISFLKNIQSFKTKNPSLYQLMEKIRHGEKLVKKISINNDTKQMAFSGFEFKVGDKNLKLLSIQDIHNLLEDKELEAWQKLIRVLTHEIMNSLTPISSLSSTTFDLIQEIEVQDDKLKEKLLDIKDALNTIHKRSEGLTDFVKAYRSLTLIPKPEFQIISVSTLFSRVYKILKPKLQKQGISFEKIIDPKSLEISADPSLMEQVLINLLLNSIHALKEIRKPKIELKCFLGDSGKVVIQVIDNGSGILEKNLGKIFVPFYSTKKSSGIGLSFCKQIMKLHNGQIKVASTQNSITFSLYF